MVYSFCTNDIQVLWGHWFACSFDVRGLYVSFGCRICICLYLYTKTNECTNEKTILENRKDYIGISSKWITNLTKLHFIILWLCMLILCQFMLQSAQFTYHCCIWEVYPKYKVAISVLLFTAYYVIYESFKCFAKKQKLVYTYLIVYHVNQLSPNISFSTAVYTQCIDVIEAIFF